MSFFILRPPVKEKNLDISVLDEKEQREIESYIENSADYPSPNFPQGFFVAPVTEDEYLDFYGEAPSPIKNIMRQALLENLKEEVEESVFILIGLE